MTASARRRPDHVAVKLDDAEVTYGLLDEGSARVAGLLAARGIGPGDRVGVMLPNVPYFPVLYYGIVRAGAVVVPMNVLLKSREIAYYLEDSGAKLLFAWHGFAEEAAAGAEKAGGVPVVAVAPGEFESLLAETEPVRELADVDGGDTAVILYTSGTTGQPKGAELTHDNLRRNAQVSVEGNEIDDEDIIFGGLPLFHTFGQTCCMNAAAYAGATLTLLAALRPGQGAGDHPARPRHALRGRPDDARGAAAPSRARGLRHVEPAPDHLGRRVAARRGAPRGRGRVRRDHPGGLRAQRDVPGGVVQQGRQAPRRLDRDPGRGRGDADRRRGRPARSRPARSGRSSSRATTS